MTPFYERDGITIYCGETITVMSQLDGPFDAIIADLPYGATACSWDTVIPFEPLWEQYKRLTRGAVVLFGSQPFTSALVMSCLEWFKYGWVWDKNRATGGTLSKIRPMKAHEDLCVFANGQHTYNQQTEQWTADEIKRMRRHDFLVSPTTPMIYSEHIAAGRKNKVDSGKTPRSIIRIPALGSNDPERCHPTQKPVALLAYLIRTYTNPGEIALDNTMGSGTTLVAAQQEGRRAVGIEISEEYCKIAVERLRQRSLWQVERAEPQAPQPRQAALFEKMEER